MNCGLQIVDCGLGNSPVSVSRDDSLSVYVEGMVCVPSIPQSAVDNLQLLHSFPFGDDSIVVDWNFGESLHLSAGVRPFYLQPVQLGCRT